MNYLHSSLAAIGLNESDVDVFLLLMKHPELTVPKMVELSGYSRTTVYDSLHNLERFHLIDSRKEKREVYYRGVHPETIRSLIHQKRQKTATTLDLLERSLTEIVELYNTNIGKPELQLLQTPLQLHSALKQLSQDLSVPVFLVLQPTVLPLFDTPLLEFCTSTQFTRHIFIDQSSEHSALFDQLKNVSHNHLFPLQPMSTERIASIIVFPTATLYLKVTRQASLLGCLLNDKSITAVHRQLLTELAAASAR